MTSKQISLMFDLEGSSEDNHSILRCHEGEASSEKHEVLSRSELHNPLPGYRLCGERQLCGAGVLMVGTALS